MTTNTYYSPFFPPVAGSGTKGTTIAVVPSQVITDIGGDLGDIQDIIDDLEDHGYTDGVAPAVPTGLTLVPNPVVTDTDGSQFVTITANWNAVTDTDLNQYVLAISEAGGGYVEFPVGSGSTTYTWQVRANRSFSVKIRAVDNAGNSSAYSTVVTTTSAKDNTNPTAPTGFTVEAAFKNFFLRWTNPNTTVDVDFDYVEVWEGTTNNAANAVIIATVPGYKGSAGTYVRSNVDSGQTRYYWLRAKDTSGNPTGTTLASAPATVVGPVNATTAGLITTTDFTPGLTPVQTVSSLPNPTGYTGPAVVLLSTDGKLYRYTGGAWVKAVDGGDITALSLGGGALADAALNVSRLFGNTIRPVEVLGALPGTGNTEGRQVYLTTDGKLYRYVSGAWTKAVDGADLTNNTITAAKFATGLNPIEVVSTLPTTGLVQGRVVLLTTDNKLYRYTGSAWTSAVPGADVTGTVPAAAIPDTSITTAKLGTNLSLVEIVSTLPTSGNYQGRTALLTTDNKLYRYTGSAWTAAVATGDLSGTISTGQIAANAINASKFANGITPVEVVATLPTTGNFNGRTAVLTSDGKLYRYDGTQWTAAVAATDLNGQIVSTQITDGAVTTDKVFANAITTGKIAVGAVKADQIAANTITASKLVIGDTSNMIPDPSIQDPASWTGDVTVSTTGGAGAAQGSVTIAPGGTGYTTPIQVDGSKPFYFSIIAKVLTAAAGNSISVYADFYNNSGGSNLAVTYLIGTFTGTGNVTTTGTFQSNTNAKSCRLRFVVAGTSAGYISEPIMRRAINGELVVDGAISTDKLAANAVTAAKIAANTITANEILAGTITAAQIASNTLTARQITVGDFQNLIPSGNFQTGISDMDYNPTRISLVTNQSDGYNGSRNYLTRTSNSAAEYLYSTNSIPVASGDQFWAEWSGKTSSDFVGQFYMVVTWYDGNGVKISEVSPGPITVANTAWQLISFAIAAPANAVTAKGGVLFANTAGTAYVGHLNLRRRAAGNLIVDGTITGTKIAATTITAANIQGSTITATQMAANSISATQLQSNSVIAAKIQAGAISTDKLAANVITASKLAVTDAQNLVLNWDYTDTGYWGTIAGFALNTTDAEVVAMNSKGAMKASGDGTNATAAAGWFQSSGQYMPVEAGKPYRVAIDWTISTGYTGFGQLRVYWFKADGSTASATSFTQLTGTPADYRNVSAGAPAGATGHVDQILYAPADAAYARYRIVQSWSTTQVNPTTGSVWYANPIVSRAANGELIVDGSITANKILAGTITSDRIAAGTIAGDRISAGTITSGLIAASAITSRELAIGDFENLATNGDFTVPATGWDFTAGGAFNTSVGYQGTPRSIRRPGAAGTVTVYNLNTIPVKALDEFYMDWAANTTGGAMSGSYQVEMQWFNGAGTYLSSSNVGSVNGALSDWIVLSGSVVAPTNAITAKVAIVFNNTTANAFVGYVSVRRKNTGALIVDGAISTNKLAANAVTADKILAGTITAAQIASGTITATKLAIGNSDNVITDANMQDINWWTSGAAGTYVAAQNGAWSFNRALTFTPGTYNNIGSNAFPMEVGATYKIVYSIFVSADFVGWFNPAISVTGVQWMSFKNGQPFANSPYAVGSNATQGWTNSGGTAQIVQDGVLTYTNPTGISSNTNKIWGFTFGGNITAGYVEFMVKIIRVSDTTLIQDGAITTAKITVNSLNGDRIQAGTLDADRIKANTILSNTITVSGVSGSNTIADAFNRATYSSVTGTPTSLSGINSAEGNKLTGIATGATKNIITNSSTAPTGPVVGDIWVDTTTAGAFLTKTWDGTQWITASSLGAPAGTNVATQTASNVATWANNPANRINAVATTIDPGKILISGATTLANWRNGTDATKIEGGAIYANTVAANKLTIGNRGISVEGIEFTANTTANTCSWTAGKITYMNDAGTVVQSNISAGTTPTYSSSYIYIYWVKDATTLTAEAGGWANANGVNSIPMAIYQGGPTVIANYGGTIIDGSKIVTGSILANNIKVGTITADRIVQNSLPIDRLNWGGGGDAAIYQHQADYGFPNGAPGPTETDVVDSNTTYTWYPLCDLYLTPPSGSPFMGFAEFYFEYLSGTVTDVRVRVSRVVDSTGAKNQIWGGRFGRKFSQLNANHRLTFYDSVDAGTKVRIRLEACSVGGGQVNAPIRTMGIFEQSRVKLQQIEILATTAVTGSTSNTPGGGSGGGGNVNGTYTNTYDPTVTSDTKNPSTGRKPGLNTYTNIP